jgi:AcrR family transcriptional regulator
MTVEVAGRPNQRRRTRKDLLEAAARLMKQGRRPTLEEIAEHALVSRATAYRYFPNTEALLVEASFDIAIPEPADLFPDGSPADPVARVLKVDTALHDLILANETSLRVMLAQSLEHAMNESDGSLPVRQNRRMPLIEAALKPLRRKLKPAAFDTLIKALALVIGTEGVIVAKDVLQLDDDETRKLKRWAICALVEAAMKPARG